MDLQLCWDNHNKEKREKEMVGGVGATCGNAEYREIQVGMGPFPTGTLMIDY